MAETKTETTEKKPSFFGRLFKGFMNIVTLGLFSKLLKRKDKVEEPQKEEPQTEKPEVGPVPQEELDAEHEKDPAPEQTETKEGSGKSSGKGKSTEKEEEPEAQPGA